MMRTWIRRSLNLTLAISALACGAAAAPALGATITVTTTTDKLAGDGRCSLREAITSANNDAAPFSGAGECARGNGPDTIVVPAGRYRLTLLGASEDQNASGDLDIRSPVTLVGAGPASTTIDAGQNDRVLQVLPGAIGTIQNVTITDGLAPDGNAGASRIGLPGNTGAGDDGLDGQPGGGILNEGTLSIVDSVITHNQAGSGGRGGSGTGGIGSTSTTGSDGGIGRGGSGGRGGPGGGVLSVGPLTLIRTVVSNNAAGTGGAGGAGIGGAGGSATTGSAGTGGPGEAGAGGSAGNGGGIEEQSGGTVTVVQSSIVANAAGAAGAGGTATGGVGGGSGGTAGGFGGAALAGNGGGGGDGGGLDAYGAVAATGDLIAGNSSGAGGAGGDAVGGDGGPDGGTNGQAGNGGVARGGLAGGPGEGGGVSADALSATNDTITGNRSGTGARGGDATGGDGGVILASGTNGSGGNADGEAGSSTGGGGLDLRHASTLDHTTISSNGLPPVGRPGSGHGGAAGRGGSGGSAGTGTDGPPTKPSVGGAIVGPGTTTLLNSVIAGNTSPSCIGTLADGGHDITFPDAACPGNVVDPRLGQLADNGGPTLTQALDSGSPAIDAVPATGAHCARTDQRGVARPQGGGCDIGAYEHAPPDVATGAATAISGTRATLGGLLTSNARPASYHFEYGKTATYGTSTPPQNAAAGVTPASVSALLSRLAPATTYHYRLIASNTEGTNTGSDHTFRTSSGTRGAPRFLAASVHPKAFAVLRSGQSAKGNPHVPRGTTFTFQLTETARVTFTIEQALPGRRVGRSAAPKHEAIARTAGAHGSSNHADSRSQQPQEATPQSSPATSDTARSRPGTTA